MTPTFFKKYNCLQGYLLAYFVNKMGVPDSNPAKQGMFYKLAKALFDEGSVSDFHVTVGLDLTQNQSVSYIIDFDDGKPA